MSSDASSPAAVSAFIARWTAAPTTAAELTTRFLRAKPDEVREILETLTALARPGDEKGTFIKH